MTPFTAPLTASLNTALNTVLTSAHTSITVGFTERSKRLWFDLDDRLFERRHGMDLGSPVAHADLVARDPISVQHATSYQGAWLRNVRVLCEQAKRARPALTTFVDIGSGKGKACFCAATQPGISEVVGVEFSQPLIDVAQANLLRFAARHCPVSLLCDDATSYLLPAATCLVFLFNPFDAVILKRFVDNNRAHFQRHP